MRNLDIADTRDKLELYAQQPVNEGQVLVEHGILLGALPPGGRDQIIEGSDEETEQERAYMIVGDPEADAKQGRVSISSPIARALIGKKLGDSVEVRTPGGAKSYEITNVAFR